VADRQGVIGIGVFADVFGDEQVPFDALHGAQDALVTNASGPQLFGHHAVSFRRPVALPFGSWRSASCGESDQDQNRKHQDSQAVLGVRASSESQWTLRS